MKIENLSETKSGIIADFFLVVSNVYLDLTVKDSFKYVIFGRVENDDKQRVIAYVYGNVQDRQIEDIKANEIVHCVGIFTGTSGKIDFVERCIVDNWGKAL